MNKAFDHNGTLVSASKPLNQLRTVKKTLLISSEDRDINKYYTNGDVVYHLPRVYENVVSIRLKSATFTPVAAQLTSPPSGTAVVHSYSEGQNIASATWSNDSYVGSVINYFLIDIEGLNKCDELSVNSQRSTFTDSYFARIPIDRTTAATGNNIISYNDHTQEENICKYSPAIGKLDRMHIVTRLHSQQDKSGFIYWTTDSQTASSNNRAAHYSLIFELEMLDNGFDQFSSFESRINNREAGNYGC